MKILVLSDSHSSRSFMRRAVDAVKPDSIIHLGDYYDDGEVVARENPHLIVHRVPGNCDYYRVPREVPQILCYPIGGVKLYMTHGHLHGVKSGRGRLIADARAAGAKAALYGHTHIPDCYQEEDGLWVLNPGACGGYGGSVGVIETRDGEISSCCILRQDDLEAMLASE